MDEKKRKDFRNYLGIVGKDIVGAVSVIVGDRLSNTSPNLITGLMALELIKESLLRNISVDSITRGLQVDFESADVHEVCDEIMAYFRSLTDEELRAFPEAAANYINDYINDTYNAMITGLAVGKRSSDKEGESN